MLLLSQGVGFESLVGKFENWLIYEDHLANEGHFDGDFLVELVFAPPHQVFPDQVDLDDVVGLLECAVYLIGFHYLINYDLQINQSNFLPNLSSPSLKTHKQGLSHLEVDSQAIPSLFSDFPNCVQTVLQLSQPSLQYSQ